MLTGDEAEQHIRCHLAYFNQRLVNSCERRRHLGGVHDIVETDHAHLIGDANIALVEYLVDACGLRVVAGEDRRGRIWPVEQVTSLLDPIAQQVVAFADQGRIQLNTLQSQYQANLTDFGIGPMPQNGGSAALTGGNLWVFNPKSSADVIKAAFDYVIYSNFNLSVVESSLAQQAANGQAVGAPTAVLFQGAFQQKLSALNARYANVPLQNYATFINSTIALHPEPHNQTQKMYATLDPVMQAILTNASADPQTLLNQAAQQFQQVLDSSPS